MDARDESLLARAIGLAAEAGGRGDHPFGALLADADREILVEAVNTVVTERDITGHAETNLVRDASRAFSSSTLASCSLYASTEPCAMCAGAIYWSGIGRVVFALDQDELISLAGEDPHSSVLRMHCATVLGAGSRAVTVEGPALTERAVAVHEGFWGAQA